MFGVGAQEMLFVGLVALLVFGPGRLMEMAREYGTLLGRARRWMDETREELASTDYPDEWFEGRGRREEDLLGGRSED